MLPDRDRTYLADEGYRYELTPDGVFLCLVLREFQLPAGYEPAVADVLIRLPPGFPDASPDMWWCDPPVRIAATGAYPVGGDAMEVIIGKTWQRFSRHLSPGAWRPGRDSIATYLSLILADLKSAVGTER